MKNIGNAVKIAVFICIFCFCFVKISYVMRHSNDELEILRIYKMQPSNSFDILLVGSCSVNRYWAPMEAWAQYGFASYNYSNGAMPPKVMKYCITEALKKQSPELLIIEVSLFSRDAESYDAGMEEMMESESVFRRFTDTVDYSINRYLMVENGVPKDQYKLNYHFDITQYHTNLTALVKKNHWKYAFNISYDETKSFGGFISLKAYRAVIRRNVRAITDEMPLSGDLDLVYRGLIDYCTKLDTNVLFVLTPAQNRENEDIYKKINYMRRVALEHNIPFIDCDELFDEIGLDAETDYYSKNHLNIFGAKKFTKWFGEYIKKSYDLPDRRGDGKYADWEIAYEQWVIESAEIEKAVFSLMPEKVQAKLDRSEEFLR